MFLRCGCVRRTTRLPQTFTLTSDVFFFLSMLVQRSSDSSNSSEKRVHFAIHFLFWCFAYLRWRAFHVLWLKLKMTREFYLTSFSQTLSFPTPAYCKDRGIMHQRVRSCNLPVCLFCDQYDMDRIVS